MSDESNNDGILMRVQHAVRRGGVRLDHARSGLARRVRATVDDTIAPAVEEAARKMLLKLAEPENAQKLQETLAGFAGYAMESGFQSDPKARLLFEFVDDLEKRHSREAVLQVVVEHAVVYETDLLATLLDAVRDPSSDASVGADQFEGLRERAGGKLLALLCSLASLEDHEITPTGREAQLEYFASAPIDDRFKPLARMAVGEKEAFDAVAETSDKPKESKPGIFGRAVRRITGDRSTALARFVPSLSDPSMRFLTTSYLFFVQSYLVRAMIEALPEMLATVRELDRQMESDADEVIELGD